MRGGGMPPDVLVALFGQANIQINGSQPFDIQVHDSRAYRAILANWSLGLGESYMDGLWDCEHLDELITRLLSAKLYDRAVGLTRLRLTGHALRARLMNLQSPTRAFQVGETHYNIGNDLFERMLDPLMIYSCAYWERAADLAQAQEDKLEMICRKLALKPGERLLDIGCGWGGLAHYAVTRYGVSVHGITVSREQRQHALERCAGLPVTVDLVDYRELSGVYDKIVSVGMFEHVGPKNYQTYFNTTHRLLADEGLFLLHTIGGDVTAPSVDPWIDRYIFPNGKIPGPSELLAAMEGRFLLEDWHNFGPDYDRTLMAWEANFVARWPEISATYGQRFFRMWRYYLLACAGYFRSRQGQLWQLVLTKQSRKSPYRSFRFS
ncbi:MAG: cyclopropane fatty acyl phospholipid synthase [Burkholderiaceae bacterium]|nr:cyclopropane fatty acyl phospholipid synthase [Burkholderiaceae bacterium]